MAQAIVTVRLTEHEPFKTFYKKMIGHMKDYREGEILEFEIMKYIYADFIEFSESIGADVRFLNEEGENV